MATTFWMAVVNDVDGMSTHTYQIYTNGANLGKTESMKWQTWNPQTHILSTYSGIGMAQQKSITTPSNTNAILNTLKH
jgi:hypothetical protein